MAFTVYISIPEGVVHATYLALLFLVAVGSWQIRGVTKDREFESDIRRRTRSQLLMPWVAEAPADVLTRPSPNISLYRVRPYADREQEILAA
jgi:hypothetical protein